MLYSDGIGFNTFASSALKIITFAGVLSNCFNFCCFGFKQLPESLTLRGNGKTPIYMISSVNSAPEKFAEKKQLKRVIE